MSEAYLIRRGGGGGSGAKLVVSAPPGATAKVTNGSKTKTKTVGSDGLAIFSGLSGGQWDASIYDNGHEETTPVPVTVVTDYAVTLSYFSALVSVSYPQGSVCTVTNGSVVLRAPDTSGAWVCDVPAPGTWTITISNGVTQRSTAVQITTHGQSVSVTLAFSLVLYEAGNQFDSLTGGWQYYTSSGTNPLTGDRVMLDYSSMGPSRVLTQNVINFGGCSRVGIHVTAGSANPGASPKLQIMRLGQVEEAAIELGPPLTGEVQLGGNYYLSLGEITQGIVQVSISGLCSVTFDKIWVE